jgi:SAM-dependent methyltransferase
VTALKYVNVGCGARYHGDWINLDIEPTGAGVIRHDLSQGLPFADSSCDVVYHSHVLEHVRRPDALPFLRECRRVLKPGGTIRVAVPDLERICRCYLDSLDSVLAGEGSREHDYDWIALELLDQMVRERSGGGMLEFLTQDPLPNERFVYGRIGEEGRELVRAIRGASTESRASDRDDRARWRRLPGRARRAASRILVGALFGGSAARALEIGWFRLGGEAHQWMYDRYSLGRLLTRAGFEEPEERTATTSRIADWARFHLDALEDGTVRKPDSLFMEAVRP